MKTETKTETIQETIQELNANLAFNLVPNAFRGHYVNSDTDKHGIKHLVAEILKENGAILPPFNGSFRKLYVNIGMTSEAIITEVRNRFGYNRYTDRVIRNTLCITMPNDGTVGIFQTESHEDTNRTCKRPRARYFLIK